MKLKYLFPIFFTVLAFMTSCEDDDTLSQLDGIQVSKSYVSLPVDGGESEITLTTNDSWTLTKVTTEKDQVEWLNVSSTSGNAGETTLTFSAESTLDGRTAEVLVYCTDSTETQRINIIQGLAQVSEATVAEALAAPDGKTLRLTGVCTNITNTLYGNWYLSDGEDEIYIYGTLDEKGGTKNFESLGLEVGDEVTIEGPRGSYKGDPQMVNVMVVQINKSLVKVDSVENAVLPVEGGEFIAYLTCKGEGVSVEIPDDAKSWLSISSIESEGTNSVVTFKAAANEGGDRETTLTFRTTDGGKKYSSQTSLSQEGAIIDASIAEFLAAEVGNTQYRLSGVISKLDDPTSGKLYLKDFSGETYVYKVQDFESKGLKEGDIITIVGKRGAYNGNPQVSGAILENSISVTATTIADVLTKEDDSSIYYMVTGEITSIDNDKYGNLYMKDGDSKILVYGLYPGYGATGDDRYYFIGDSGIKVGDKLTVIGTKTSYDGENELKYSFYYSHESAE
nr:BACON domain-containing carbohydrate-binding protein [uncultured Carboxylicivirga sp.]